MLKASIQRASQFFTGPQPTGGAAGPVAGSADEQAAYQAASAYLDAWAPSKGLASAQAAASSTPAVIPTYTGAPLPLPAGAPIIEPPPLPEVRYEGSTALTPGDTPLAAPAAPIAPPVAPAVAPPAFSTPLPDIQPESASVPAEPAAPASTEPVKGKGPLLMDGHSGDPVKRLQQRLAALGIDPGPIDGIFGPKTLAAVKAFQQAHGLEVDGKVGPQTWEALGIVVEGTPHQSRKAGQTEYTEGPGGIVNTPDGAMVRRDGHLISARIAEQYDKMVAAAAADGVTLSINSAYRSYAEQVVLWDKYGHDTSRVARPGTSNHQSGTAIDFGNEGWDWLKRNATRFGFHNYPPEPWHYSLDGH